MATLLAMNRSAVEAEAQRMEAQQSRAAAYTAEADPLFFKSQRGEGTIEEWRLRYLKSALVIHTPRR
jgi:hypothetical protein